MTALPSSPATLNAGTLTGNAEFRRLCLYSGVGHGIVVLAVWTAGLVHWPRPIAPAPIFIDLVSAAALAPPAPPSVEPAPPREKPVVIPERPRPKPKPAAKPAPKPEPKPERETPPPSAEQLLAKIRERVATTPDATRTPTSASSRAGRFDPILAAYRRRVMVLLRNNWVGARAFATLPGIEVQYEVRIDGSGGVRSVSLLRGSGNRYYDESAERAIRKTSPFPRPPRPLTLQLRFSPEGVL